MMLKRFFSFLLIKEEAMVAVIFSWDPQSTYGWAKAGGRKYSVDERDFTTHSGLLNLPRKKRIGAIIELDPSNSWFNSAANNIRVLVRQGSAVINSDITIGGVAAPALAYGLSSGTVLINGRVITVITENGQITNNIDRAARKILSEGFRKFNGSKREVEAKAERLIKWVGQQGHHIMQMQWHYPEIGEAALLITVQLRCNNALIGPQVTLEVTFTKPYTKLVNEVKDRFEYFRPIDLYELPRHWGQSSPNQSAHKLLRSITDQMSMYAIANKCIQIFILNALHHSNNVPRGMIKDIVESDWHQLHDTLTKLVTKYNHNEDTAAVLLLITETALEAWALLNMKTSYMNIPHTYGLLNTIRSTIYSERPKRRRFI